MNNKYKENNKCFNYITIKYNKLNDIYNYKNKKYKEVNKNIMISISN